MSIEDCSPAEREILNCVPSGMKLRILALHPKCSWAERFVQTLGQLKLPAHHFEFIEADAPFLLQEDGRGGRQWWKLPPNERSYTTESYEGDEEAIKICEDVLGRDDGKEQVEEDKIDGILGFSQGAMLVAIIVAKIITGSSNGRLPQFAMLFGAAIPRPFEDDLWKMREILAVEENWPCIDATTGMVSSPPSRSRLHREKILREKAEGMGSAASSDKTEKDKNRNDDSDEAGGEGKTKNSQTGDKNGQLPFGTEPSIIDKASGDKIGTHTICSFHALSERDRTNPSEMGDWVAQCFGKYAEMYWHDEGHRMPMEAEGLKRIRMFLFRQLKYKADGRMQRPPPES